MNMSLLDSVRADVQSFLENNKKLMFNERDLQMHLALYLLNTQKYTNVHMEYYVPYEKLSNYVWNNELRLDIVVEYNGEFCPIELKYKTKQGKEDLDIKRFGESLEGVVILKNQSAQDLARYDFWKDIRRIELVKGRFEKVSGGLAIFVTNDPAYKKSPRKDSNNLHFSLEGGTHSKKKNWVDNKRPCAENRPNFEVNKDYEIRWDNYTIGKETNFHYCIVSI